ncbi:Ger(x)C family spore germination protein [Fredinandcohnia sp. 179-A 10B2 NHS]|uniref:Ger(x)C family spore germination protein n=1 Tax=Fredinandcohnia sp. 179-A 10B2 NHS TaxID=3235176 RepID=UPI0039A0166E
MKRWRHVFFIFLVCILCLFGCARTRIIDKLSIIHVFGFDLADNGDLVGTALFPEYTKSKSDDQIQYIAEQAPTGVLFVPRMSEQTSTPVEIAKIRVLLFGKDYAEAGIKDMVNRFILNPQLGTNIQIAASTHSARETLSTFKNEKSLTLADRIQQNIQGQTLPRLNLHIFLNNFYGEGGDAYVPMLTIDENNKVKVDGIGVFKDDKLKLHLNEKQTALFSYIKDRRSQATYKISLKDNDRAEIITVRNFRSKSNWDWNHNKEQLSLRLQLQMTLTQFPDRFNAEKAGDVMEIKKLIVENLKREMEDLLTTFQENEVDPLGIGNIVRSKDKTWKVESFYKKYPSIPINLDVNVKIIHSGLGS